MITSLTQLQSVLQSYMPATQQKVFSAGIGLERTKQLLKKLDNPHQILKPIHIAGTSGKGSTATIISHLLQRQGFTTGLHLSPHLLDIRERWIVNNTLLSESKTFKYTNYVLSQAESLPKINKLNYFQISTCLALYIFAQEQVEYAIIETGLGGTYDATNVFTQPKIAVITPIAYDHMEILGHTLPEIASQKAGIIHKKDIVISSPQSLDALQVIKQKAKQTNSTLISINETDYQVQELTSHGTSFSTSLYSQTLHTGVIGIHQAQNITVALHTLQALAKRDHFKIDQKKIQTSLSNLTIPGRLEIIQAKNQKLETRNLILDGAHNPDKMQALIQTLRQLYPHNKFTFLLAFKSNKDIPTMLNLLKPHADQFLFTQFFVNQQDLARLSASTDQLKQIANKLQLSNTSFIPNTHQALELILKQNDTNPLIITGSLYLLSEIYSLLSPKPHS